MADVTCAQCGETDEPAATAHNLAICANCGVTLVVDGATTRTAGFSDVVKLSEPELKTLRRAHGAITRPGKKQR